MSEGPNAEVAQPAPEEDPFSCSICGQPLGLTTRVEGGEYCDGCLREYGGGAHR
jgi:hypothetical protein